MIRTVNPDGSQQRVIYGVPSDLSDPDTFIPTPWESYTYDANDLAPLSEGLDADDNPIPLTNRAPASHHFTPASFEIDALSRAIRSTQRNGAGPQDEIATQSSYDIRGNVLTVIDALGRSAFGYIYDLANRPVRVFSIDAGITRTALDALGNGVEQRDSKGALALSAFDPLNRLVDVWARDNAAQRATLRQHLIYGDNAAEIGLDQAHARQRNALGRLVSHYDEAGRVLASDYDFKGNLLEKTRQVIRDQEILSVFDGAAANNWQVNAYQVDWQPEEFSIETRAAAILDTTEYTTTTRYDGQNRAHEIEYPRDVDNERKVLRPRYNRAGGLESFTFDGEVYVERIAYNAKGQRTLIAYANGVMTRYAYNPHTFRLNRLRSERYSQPDDSSYQPTGLLLQDFRYEYDLSGNITTIRDRTPESGIPNTLLGAEALDRIFSYDAIYRLLSANGRECDIRPALPPWFDEPRCNDVTRTRVYTERYEYNPAGNMVVLQHQNENAGFTRQFSLAAINNRLEMLTVGQTDFHYTYDLSGNMIAETTSRHFEWDYANRMKVFRTQTDDAEPSVHAHYLYDSNGQRVKKVVRHQGGEFETTEYVDSLFERHQRIAAASTTENNTLHMMDDQSRIALVRVGNPFSADSMPAVQFQLADHLGSSNCVISANGDLLSREEYAPYGETSFGSVERKRYRFTAKEREPESGLNYHEARYYAPWLARWVTADPLGPKDNTNLFTYVRNNPTNLTDTFGLSADSKRPIKLDPHKCYDPGTVALSVHSGMMNVDNLSPEQQITYGAWQAEQAAQLGDQWRIDFEGPSMSATTPERMRAGMALEAQRQLRERIFLIGYEKLRTSPAAAVGYGLSSLFSDDPRVHLIWMFAGELTAGLAGARLALAGNARRYRPFNPAEFLSPVKNMYMPRDKDTGELVPLPQRRVDGIDIPIPDPKAVGEHTTLGSRINKHGEIYRQSAQFPAGASVPWGRTDWSVHDKPPSRGPDFRGHTNPHTHEFRYDFIQRQWTRRGAVPGIVPLYTLHF